MSRATQLSVSDSDLDILNLIPHPHFLLSLDFWSPLLTVTRFHPIQAISQRFPYPPFLSSSFVTYLFF